MTTVASSELPASDGVPARWARRAPSAGEVFQLIRTGAAQTRRDVGRLTGLSRTAVAARLRPLLASGLVVEGEEGPSTGGRPPARLRFDHRSGTVLAAAIGRSRTQLAVCDLRGDILQAVDVEQEPGADPALLMPAVVGGLAGLLRDSGWGAERVRAVGVSLPGTVDVARGALCDSPILSGWNGVALPPYFRELADVPVLVEKDTNVLALSERHAYLQSFADLLFVKASTGLGAGVVSDGQVRRGAHGAAGEIGHTKSPAAVGAECRCGDTGCVEAVAGGWALVQAMRARGRSVSHLRGLTSLAADGDAEARRAIRESGRRVGEVLGGAVNLLNPQAVVIGGDMVGAYDVFVAGIRETLYGAAMAASTGELEILPASHGEAAGLVGCAALALDDVLSVRAVDASSSGTG